MRLACRHESLHNAVRLVARSRFLPPHTRCISATSAPYGSEERYLLGGYTPRPQPNPQAKRIAVLGGGITGLTAAFDLARDIPNARITVYEQQDRFGGWVDADHLEVDDGKVLFEWGPRTLRPDLQGSGSATLALILRLGGLTTEPLSHRSAAATNRYIYYPDHLVRMPQPIPGDGVVFSLAKILYSLFTEPAFRGWRGIIGEPTVPPRHSAVQDESVGDFITRRFGSAIADNLVSALFHGIYAGDIYKLSARTLLSQLWYLETRDRDGNGIMGEIGELFFRGHLLKSYDSIRFHNRHIAFEFSNKLDTMVWQDTVELMRNASIYRPSFGMCHLIELLKTNLKENPNVRLSSSTRVEALEYSKKTHKFMLSHTGPDKTPEKTSADYVVNTLSPNILADIVAPAEVSTHASSGLAPPSLSATLRKCSPGSVNVMVVNLYYKNPDLLSVSGFGYLLPRSVPIDQNPERALGVIFASQAGGARGEEAIKASQRSQASYRESLDYWRKQLEHCHASPDDGTSRRRDAIADIGKHIESLEKSMALVPALDKVTSVGLDTASGTKLTVMLGGHWWSDWVADDLPSEDEAIEMAKSVLARHLKISEQPLLAKAKLQRNCIPQYQVGYHSDMARINTGLMHEFEGRLKVAGSWWQGGVGINDCVKSAREISTTIREGWDSLTGIDEFGKPSKWVLKERRTGKWYMDPMSPT